MARSEVACACTNRCTDTVAAAMESPAPLQNTLAVDDAIALVECVRWHLAHERVQNGISFIITGGRNEHIDARRLLHAARSPYSIIAFHRVEEVFGAYTCSSVCQFACIPEEVVAYTATYLCAFDIFNLSRACKQLACSFSVSLGSDGGGPLRRHVERAARLPSGLTACALMREMDSALCVLGYFSHSNVHKFKHGSERQSCLNALAYVHSSGGVRRLVSVLPNNAEYRSGSPIFSHSGTSPSGTFVLYVPSHDYHIYLLEKKTHMQLSSYSVVAREEVGPGIDIGIQWTLNGPKVNVYHMRTKRSVVASVVETRP